LIQKDRELKSKIERDNKTYNKRLIKGEIDSMRDKKMRQREQDRYNKLKRELETGKI